MQYLLDKFNAILAWFVDFVTWGAEKVFQLLMDGLGALIASIPVPAWLENAGAVVSNMPSGVAYVAAAFALPQGIAIIVGAYTIRFIIRRLPFVG